MVRYADDAVFFFSDEAECRKFSQGIQRADGGLQTDRQRTEESIFKFQEYGVQSFQLSWIYFLLEDSRIKGEFLMVKTEKKEALQKAMQEFDDWIKTNRSKEKVKDLWETCKGKNSGTL